MISPRWIRFIVFTPLAVFISAGFLCESATNAPPSQPFVFSDFHPRTSHTYPWKTAIRTTVFELTRASHNNGSVNNYSGAWATAKGVDTPVNPTYVDSNSARLNTFYLALPFNDLAHPKEALHWVPSFWYPKLRSKTIGSSVCKDRWVEIKNRNGKICFAQWEDVGPSADDQPEYVFGSKRLDEEVAGLALSPSAAKYLDMDKKSPIVSWRFIDEEDVPPGPWLVYDEQDLLYRPMPH